MKFLEKVVLEAREQMGRALSPQRTRFPSIQPSPTQRLLKRSDRNKLPCLQ